jgi:ribosome-binding factor A
MSSTQWHIDRLKEHLSREISWTIANKVNDPRIPDVVTIANIKLAQDTRNATIYVSIYGDEKRKKGALIALNHATSFIQKCVASKISVKHFPKLNFKIDSSFEHSEHINNLLEKIKDDLV